MNRYESGPIGEAGRYLMGLTIWFPPCIELIECSKDLPVEVVVMQ